MKRTKIKKIVVLALSVAIVAMFTACGGSSSGGSAASSGSASASAASGSASAAADGQTYELRLATMYPAEHEMTVSVQAACDKIEEETGGAVKIQIYPSDQLGDYTAVYEEIMKGTIDMGVETIVTTYDPTLEMLTIPYLASSYQEAKDVFCNPDSYFYQTVKEHQEALGVETLGIYISGSMGIGASKHLDNVMDPNTAKSDLIRCPSMDSYLWTAEGFGFKTVTVPYSELYTALQTGVCDGWVGGGAYVNYISFRDVLKYFADARYLYEQVVCTINKDLFDGMPAEYQEIIQNAITESTYSFTDQMEDLDTQAMKDMSDMGIEIYSPTEEEYDTMKTYFKENVWPKYENTLDKAVYDSLLANGLTGPAE